ncbi:LacI family transcriptional regulator [Kribbella sp. NBC_01505]|uniref:LacI family DNA-binding transcriptional regulator n=1 Tax=Kribbella sp. NBC_01505 TaxID=2903580 RepID=UPI0038687BF9
MAKRVTIAEVAHRVGVTPATVSMALSGNTRISAATRAKVEQAAAELGYVPSSAGRALRRQQAGAVALIVPNTSDHTFGHLYFMHVLTGLAKVAARHGSQVIVSTSDGATGTAYERVLQSRSADGVIVTSAAVDDPNMTALIASGLPAVLIGNSRDTAAISVGIDDVTASETITRHLIDVHGCRHLLHVTGTLDHQAGIDRLEGFRRAVRAAGVESAVVEGDLSEPSGAAAVQHLPTPVDGIVSANDDMAVGALRVLLARGVAVPDQVRIVGFDDFGLSRLTTPMISTVTVPAEEMARVATETLFAVINGTHRSPAHTELPVRYTYRRSCGC